MMQSFWGRMQVELLEDPDRARLRDPPLRPVPQHPAPSLSARVLTPFDLEELRLDRRLTRALVEHHGPEGRLLGAIGAYEAGHREDASGQPPELAAISRIYAHCLLWADDTAAQLDRSD